jgi:tryptophanyl-tRNA synthetase
MVTDPARIKKEDKGHPEVCSVFDFYKVFAGNQTNLVGAECREAKRGCVACKKELGQCLVEYLSPFHARRKELEKHPAQVDKILAEGAGRAKEAASNTLHAVRCAMGLA